DRRGTEEDRERRGGKWGQGEKAGGDGTAIGTFAARAFDVDVKPLVVARARRELVDASLVDCDPFGNAELAAHERSNVRETERSLCQGGHVTHSGLVFPLARHASRGCARVRLAPGHGREIVRAALSCRACRRWS